jgi:hypothetical protein
MIQTTAVGRALKVLGEYMRTTLMAVGAITIYDYSEQRWPEETRLIGILLLVLLAVLLLWFTIVAPFLSGLRDEPEADAAPTRNGKNA